MNAARVLVAVIAVCATHAQLAAAQAAGTVVVRVSVTDSAGAAVSGADATIVRGINTTVARASTDARGVATVVVPRAAGEQQLSVRHVGHVRAFLFFSIEKSDSISLSVVLAAAPVLLAPVSVTAAEDRKRASYHLDAEDIENSTRPIFDAADIFKLKPDMMNSRGGAMACAVPYTDRDGWIESVWVNGQRVRLAMVDSQFVSAQKRRLGVATPPPRPQPRLSRSSRAPARHPPSAPASHLDSVLSILHSIQPEHIAEITYHDCFDMSVGKNQSDLAMFIALKPGIGYDPSRGSYVVGAPAARDSVHAPTISVAGLPRYRYRLLGIYDEQSGDPLGGVEVSDPVSGLRAASSATGTVSLFFLSEGVTTVGIRAAGYRDTSVTITISPVDTIPITLVLVRSKPPDNRETALTLISKL